MKRKHWHANLPAQHKATLNAAVAALGVDAGEPSEGPDGCFVLPVRQGASVSGMALAKLAASASNFVVKPLALVVYFSATEDILALERASHARQAERALDSVIVKKHAAGVPPALHDAVTVAMRQVARLLPVEMRKREDGSEEAVDCGEVARPGHVSIVAQLRAGFLWSEVSQLVRSLGGFKVSVSLRFGDEKAVEFSVDM